MTVDSPANEPEATGLPAVTPDTDAGPDAAGSRDLAIAGGLVRSYLQVSLAFLAVSLVIGLIAALQRLLPGFLSGVDFLSYGKLYPIATDMFLYGWLTIGLGGALIYLVARSGGVAIASEMLGRIALGLLSLGVIAGSVGIAVGLNEGRSYLEYPLWADAALGLGMVLLAVVVCRTVWSSDVASGPVQWYAIAATWWLVLAYAMGNLPGLTGVASAMQTSFYRASFTGLWVASAGVAIVYFVIPRLAGRSAFPSTRLTLLGFWSLAFVWALTAPSDLVYSPVPDWLETVGVIFSIGLIIPPIIIFSDIVLAMRGRWHTVADGVAIRFVMFGAALFAVFPLINLMLAFRASSSILQFTDWTTGLQIVGIYGAFTAWLIAYVYNVGPEIRDNGTRPRLARIHYLGSVIGLVTWLIGSAASGLVAGWTWVASANDVAVPTAGPGFQNTIDGIETATIIAFVGLAIFVIAQLVFVVNVFMAVPADVPVDVMISDIEDFEPDPELVLLRPLTTGRLVSGLVVLFGIAALLVLLIPSLDIGGVESTILADDVRTYTPGTPEAEGREIYIAQGCWYCHTQQVRPIVTDVGLGAVSVAGDYVHETPVLFGTDRIGPDLMHAGSRPETDDPAWVAAHLENPQDARPFSTMPSYSYLSASEIEALAAYISNSK